MDPMIEALEITQEIVCAGANERVKVILDPLNKA
jgi:hypothetical protein